VKIILLGPPGAGKGTQAKVLAEKLSLPHISTGDLLRQNVAADTGLGKDARSFMDKGALVPDELVTRMLSERITHPDVKKGFILDGYPRNISQAKGLDDMLKSRNTGIDMVIYLDTSVPLVIQRLSGRLVCQACGLNFHITNMPPKKAMICDSCGASLYQRTDDNEETIKKRLEVYKKESSPVIEYYEAKQKLHRLSADEDAGIVLGQILELVKRHNTNDSLKV